MRAFTTAHKAARAEEATHEGWLLAIAPVGLPAVYLNTFGADYSYGGNSYLGDPGFVMGRVRLTDGSDPGTLEVEVPVSDDGPVTPDDVTRGLYAGAAVVLRSVDWHNGHVSPPIGYKWTVGRTVITDDGKAAFDIRADTRILRELILKKIGATCTADWGSARCGVNAALYTDAVTVASVTSLYEFTITGSSRANGFYDNGAIKFTSGDNINRPYTVRKWTLATGKVLLWEPLQAALTVGDAASIHAGCDKTRATCHSKFNNVARFQGFADLPDDDAKFAYEGEVAASQPVVTNPEPPRFSTGWGAG